MTVNLLVDELIIDCQKKKIKIHTDRTVLDYFSKIEKCCLKLI